MMSGGDLVAALVIGVARLLGCLQSMVKLSWAHMNDRLRSWSMVWSDDGAAAGVVPAASDDGCSLPQ